MIPFFLYKIWQVIWSGWDEKKKQRFFSGLIIFNESSFFVPLTTNDRECLELRQQTLGHTHTSSLATLDAVANLLMRADRVSGRV